MAGLRKYKLTDAMGRPSRLVGDEPGGKLAPTLETVSEQVREAQETVKAVNSGKSSRDRMIDIGRGNQQSGRQGQ